MEKRSLVVEETEIIEFAKVVEILAVIALVFGIISLGLSYYSETLQETLADPSATNPSATNKPDLETEIKTLNITSMVFKILDILLVFIVIAVNAKEIVNSVVLLKNLSFRKLV